MATTEPTEPLRLTNLINVTFNEGTGALAKTSGVCWWDATASSVDFIGGADSQRRGISCRIPPEGSGRLWMMGLVSTPHGQQQQHTIAQRVDWQCLTYAACVSYDGRLCVYETGRDCCHFKRLQSGDYIKVLLNSESPPSIEYHINGDLVYKSKTPVVFPLFPKICASGQGPLAEDLRWILRDPPASPAGIEDPATRIAELEGRIAEMQNQLRICEEEKRDLHAGTEAKQAEIEDLHAANEQQKKEMKAMSDALVAVTKEKAQLLVQLEAASAAVQSASDAKAEVDSENKELQMQLEAERDASRAAAEEKALAEEQHKELKAENAARLAALKAEMEAAQTLAEQLQRELRAENEARVALTQVIADLQMQLAAERETSQTAAEKKVPPEEQPEVEKAASSSVDDEKFELQIRASRLHGENQALHKAVRDLADEKVQLQVEKQKMHAEMQGLRRQLLQSEGWEDVDSSAAASSAGGNAA